MPGYAAMGAATLAMALGLGGLMHSRTTVAGTALPLADADAATYGVSAVYQLDDTTYYVVGSRQGFQSEVQAGVTLDRDGNVPCCVCWAVLFCFPNCLIFRSFTVLSRSKPPGSEHCSALDWKSV